MINWFSIKDIMKRTLYLIILLAAMPAAAQRSANLSFGWQDNASSDWIKSLDGVAFSNKPFSLWGNGWQAGGGLEYRAKDWLSYGVSGSCQIFSAQPSGRVEGPALYGFYQWAGQSSWQAPINAYCRLIRPKALLGTNLKLGLGVMASHIGQLTVTSASGDYAPSDTVTLIVAGTGETVYRPFGQISAGIKFPVTSRVGITLDYGFLMTFDRMVMEMPLELGLAVGW